VRKPIKKIDQKDYHDFLNIANEYGLTVEEKIYALRIFRTKKEKSSINLIFFDELLSFN
jgi:hypothetical protein